MNHATQSFERSNDFRKTYARRIFAIESMTFAIKENAEEGHRYVQIHQEYPYTLQQTAAAQAAEMWLDENGYRYVWQTVYVQKDFLQPHSGDEYLELEIHW